MVMRPSAHPQQPAAAPARGAANPPAGRPRGALNLWNSAALLAIHAGALLVFVTGVSRAALVAAACVYWIQIFGISAGYHRYFAHRSFRTSRAFQFVLAWLGGTAAQMGPLWWASYHRRHHQHADGPEDVHSPLQYGFFWAHLGWILDANSAQADPRYVRDWARFPELCWLDRVRWLPPLSVIVTLAGIGLAIGESPWRMVVWGFFVATTVSYQVTFCVNSIAHLYGRQRFATGDASRNLAWLALLTNGEGWHNNHHRYPSSEKHGMPWWELDVTHYLLRGFEKMGLVWGIKVHPR